MSVIVSATVGGSYACQYLGRNYDINSTLQRRGRQTPNNTTCCQFGVYDDDDGGGGGGDDDDDQSG